MSNQTHSTQTDPIITKEEIHKLLTFKRMQNYISRQPQPNQRILTHYPMFEQALAQPRTLLPLIRMYYYMHQYTIDLFASRTAGGLITMYVLYQLITVFWGK